MSTELETQTAENTAATVSHLAPRGMAEAGWKYGMSHVLSMCGKGKVRIGSSAKTARIITPAASPREFCPECVAIRDRRICDGMNLGGSDD